MNEPVNEPMKGTEWSLTVVRVLWPVLSISTSVLVRMIDLYQPAVTDACSVWLLSGFKYGDRCKFGNKFFRNYSSPEKLFTL